MYVEAAKTEFRKNMLKFVLELIMYVNDDV